MKCPRCGKKINKVEIIVQTRLEGKLRGNRIIEQEPLGDVEDSREIKCPECNQEITLFIEEKEERR